MKKELTVILITLMLLTLTMGGVSYAYFMSKDPGDVDQSIGVAQFSFDASSDLTAGAVTQAVRFPAPTVLNFPALEIAADNSNAALFDEIGDDAYFNDVCAVVTITVTNTGKLDLYAYFDFQSVTTAFSGAIGNPDYSDAVRWFVLPETAGVIDTDYAARIRAAVKEFETGVIAEPYPTNADGTPDYTRNPAKLSEKAWDVRSVSEKTLATAQKKLKAFPLDPAAPDPAASSAGTKTPIKSVDEPDVTQRSAKFTLVLWLDYAAMLGKMGGNPVTAAQNPGSFTVTITAYAEQTGIEEGAA